jgi:putative Mg2+ transporter-C (MgtC) family protein
MNWEEIAMRLGVALLLGGAIGLERQWRSRYVGLRTNTLLTIGSAAMMIFALMLPTGSDPAGIVHIVAGIITGVGFLGAGVIVKEGMTVKGFNTAATLWCSVAVGLFVGAGFFAAATILTAFIVLVNLFLRPVVYYINAKTDVPNGAEPGGRDDAD